MMRQILFIEPTSAQINIFSRFTLPRLGSFILAGLVNRRPGWTARVFIEGRQRFNLDNWIAENGRPRVVGISTITSTAKRGYAISDECRCRGIPVIIGGPHVTFLADEALKHANFVVRGEGEFAMDALLDLWSEGCVSGADPRLALVPNLTWQDAGGRVRHNKLARWVDDLDALPVPDFSLAGGTASCVVAGKQTVMVQTSRGCPFDCSFCSVTGMFGKRLRYRSVGAVVNELRQYNTPDHFVFFCDDNFTGNRRRVRDLLEAMLAERFRFDWSTQVRSDVARDPDLVRLMKRAGCYTVFVGFESVNPTSLKEMKKSQDLDDIRNAIRILQEARINVHGMFVLGFEGDYWETVEATIRFIQTMRLTSVQLLLLTPLPGSELYRQLVADERITSFDWELYDAHHVVFRPKHFTPFELQCAQVYGHTRLYSLGEGVKKLITGRWVSAGLSMYGWKINRDWQKQNQPYLHALATESDHSAAGILTATQWTDAARKPSRRTTS